MNPADPRLKWIRHTSSDRLEDALEGAIRARNEERAELLRFVLKSRADRLAKQLARHQRRTSNRPAPRPCRSWQAVINDVCDHHKVEPRDVLEGWRTARLAACRFELWWTLNSMGASLSEIGRRLGGYHHTTVMHGVRQWAARMEEGQQVHG